MLRFVLRKIQNKKWLTACLILGLVFLTAAVSCQPMFEAGALNKTLLSGFHSAGETNNTYPAAIGRTGAYIAEKRPTVAAVTEGINDYKDAWHTALGEIKEKTSQSRISLDAMTCQGSLGSKGNYLSVSYMPELLDHIEILTGTDYTAADDSYACIMSESVMDACGLTVGETLDFVTWTDADGESLKLTLAGVFRESESSDIFWYERANDAEDQIYVSEETFDEIVARFPNERINYAVYSLLDYCTVNQLNVQKLENFVEQTKQQDENFTENFSDILSDYERSKNSIEVTLWVLTLPMLGLVLAFIYMVTGQIIEAEKGEIAMLRSRGFGRKKIVAIYALQALLLSLFSILPGVPLGFVLCRLAASTTDFLTFAPGNLSMYGFTPRMILYALAAAAVGTIMILIPVLANSGVSIVQQKSKSRAQSTMFWEQYFLDVALLAVSLYLLHNFNQETDKLMEQALSGSRMDPMIFLDAVAFIAAAGLVCLRLVHYLVRLIYRIGRKHWSPAIYASFLQITRNFKKQGFISVFLVLTVALGLFNANTARTINQNYENRTAYAQGADIVLQENWKMQSYYVSANEIDYAYIENDPFKFNKPIDAGLCTDMAKVMRTNNLSVTKGKTTVESCEFMAVDTKEFGQTADLADELNTDVHWYTYLNALAVKENGVILSSNLAEALGVSVGDSVKCIRYGDVTFKKDEARGTISGEVVAIVSAWPGFEQYTYADGEETENYLIVANYTKAVQAFKMAPYEVWYRLADGADASDVQALLTENGADFSYFDSLAEKISDMKETAMLRITNGMFTLGFLVAIILCMVGFLIYWISSIRQRELLFGVYRAMGMRKKEINRMLVCEHLFGTVPAIAAGVICGGAATGLFAKLFGMIYLPQKHNLGIYIYLDVTDIWKLSAVLLVMIVLCIVILRKLVKALNITQALKLGEE